MLNYSTCCIVMKYEYTASKAVISSYFYITFSEVSKFTYREESENALFFRRMLTASDFAKYKLFCFQQKIMKKFRIHILCKPLARNHVYFCLRKKQQIWHTTNTTTITTSIRTTATNAATTSITIRTSTTTSIMAEQGSKSSSSRPRQCCWLPRYG